ncbi:MAG: TIGR03943 family protein [Desulfocapsaceae bacterium]|nr:TIGR03943 family protein [Desulfocapsaceae bacterium]
MRTTLQIIKLMILAEWACFFGWLVSYGQSSLNRLLHPNLWWLLICAAIILMLFLAVNLQRQITPSRQGEFWLQCPSLLILLIPLLYFIPAQQGRLNATSLEKRGIQTNTGFIQGNIATDTAANDSYPPLLEKKKAPSDIPLTKLAMNPDEYMGKEVEVVCKTFIDPRLPDDLFMCYRYLITCCAADAMPVFLFIKYSEAKSIKNDSWIRAKGPFSLIENAKTTVPSIQSDSILYIDEPPFPYIF